MKLESFSAVFGYFIEKEKINTVIFCKLLFSYSFVGAGLLRSRSEHDALQPSFSE